MHIIMSYVTTRLALMAAVWVGHSPNLYRARGGAVSRLKLTKIP